MSASRAPRLIALYLPQFHLEPDRRFGRAYLAVVREERDGAAQR